MSQTRDLTELQNFCKTIRRHIVEMITEAKSGHPGGSLSSVETLAVLYKEVMRHDPKNPTWPERDRFILGKGHAAPVLYAVLAECGYTPVDELKTLRRLGSIYQGHPDRRPRRDRRALAVTRLEAADLGLPQPHASAELALCQSAALPGGPHVAPEIGGNRPRLAGPRDLRFRSFPRRHIAVIVTDSASSAIACQSTRAGRRRTRPATCL